MRVGGKLIGNSELSRSNLLMVSSYCKTIGQKQLSICHNRDADTLDIFPDSASQSTLHKINVRVNEFMASFLSNV